jgi:hypothetical protein
MSNPTTVWMIMPANDEARVHRDADSIPAIFYNEADAIKLANSIECNDDCEWRAIEVGVY